MATFTASPLTTQPIRPSTDDSSAISTCPYLIESKSSRAYGFHSTDTLPAFLRRYNISCAPASVGLAKTRAEWDKHCSPIGWTAYERMKPAFNRVGAMMMMSEPFFARILFAPIELLKSSFQPKKSGMGRRTCLHQKYVTAKKQEWDEYSLIHQQLSSRLRVFMGRDDGSIELPNSEWHGCTKYEWDKPSHSQLSLHINGAYLRFFSDRDYEFFSDETKNNILFQLAITVGHELAHMMWVIRMSVNWILLKERYPDPEDRPYFDFELPEPLYDPNFQESELGNAWEHYMLGGIVRYANEDLFDLLGPGGDLVRVDSLEISYSHDFNVKHGNVVPGQWQPLDGRIVNAFFSDKAFSAAFRLRLDLNSQPQVLTVMSILEALALASQLKIPSPWLQQAMGRQSVELNIAEGLPDVSLETMADLAGLELA